MHQEIKAKWLEALRSGRYEQGKNELCFDNQFCCLGVLCDIVDPQGWAEDDRGDPRTRLHHEERTVPSLELLDIVGISEDLTVPVEPEPVGDDGEPGLGYTFVLGRLAVMNDHRGKSFEEIADWIEEKL